MLIWLAFFVAAATAATTVANPHLRRANGTALVPLRILPLGASVTFGVGSTTGNSYRKDLRDALVASGRDVDYVGTVQHGDFADNACEAYSGFVFNQLAPRALAAVPQFLPNLVLVDLGTNNCNSGRLVPDMGRNVSSLVEQIYTLSPGATVLLATVLVNNQTAAQESCRQDVNRQYAQLETTMRSGSRRFALVDMRSGPDGLLPVDLADRRHPNDAGYTKMAKNWLRGIQEAEAQGMVTMAQANRVADAGGAAATASTSAAMGGGGSVAANDGSTLGVLSLYWMVLISVALGFVSWS